MNVSNHFHVRTRVNMMLNNSKHSKASKKQKRSGTEPIQTSHNYHGHQMGRATTVKERGWTN